MIRRQYVLEEGDMAVGECVVVFGQEGAHFVLGAGVPGTRL